MAEKSKSTLRYSHAFWLFLLGSMLGTLFEGIWCRVRQGHWETHTVAVWGPFCIIYGIGAVGFYLAYLKLKNKNVFIQFVTIAVIADIVEYACSCLLEYGLGMKAWDYAGCLYNIKGRISPTMTLLWGTAGVVFIRLFAPFIERELNKMQGRYWQWPCAALSVFMAVNLVFTGFCIVRWSQRHYTAANDSAFFYLADKYYDDEKMQKIFCEWFFIE